MPPSAGSEKKGGRKKASVAQPGLVEAIAATVADHTAGSPVDPSLLWTNRSPRDIAEELACAGFEVGPDTVRTILTEDLGLSLRQAVKDEATCNFPQRDEQFEHIGRLRKTFQREGCPVLSIDTKQKELLGNFFRPGRAYTNGQVHVLDHDFATHGHGRMVPYGVYDVARNEGLDAAVGRPGHQPIGLRRHLALVAAAGKAALRGSQAAAVVVRLRRQQRLSTTPVQGRTAGAGRRPGLVDPCRSLSARLLEVQSRSNTACSAT